MVIFSIERAIAVYFPLKCRTVCSSTNNRLGVLCISLLGSIIYSVNLSKTALETRDNSNSNATNVTTGKETKCETTDSFFAKYMTFVDIIITMMIPFILICVLNALIAAKLSSLTKNTTGSVNPQHTCTHHTNSNHSTDNTINNHNKNSLRLTRIKTDKASELNQLNEPLYDNSAKEKRKKSYTKTTKLLFSISISFLTFHCPIALCKIYYFIKYQASRASSSSSSLATSSANMSFVPTSDELSWLIFNASNDSNAIIYNEASTFGVESPIEHLIERVTSHMYYLNFIMNFFLYSMNGSKFREALFNIFYRLNKTKSKSSSQKEIQIKSKINVSECTLNI